MKTTSFFVHFLTASLCLFANSALADSTWELVEAANSARNQYGLPSLRIDNQLMNSASTHARDMAQRNYFSHSTPEGWGIGLRIYGWGYPRWAGVAENIAGGQNSGWKVVQSWLASPGHRANLLNGAFKAMGIGHYYQPNSNYTNYWVSNFGTE